MTKKTGAKTSHVAPAATVAAPLKLSGDLQTLITDVQKELQRDLPLAFQDKKTQDASDEVLKSFSFMDVELDELDLAAFAEATDSVAGTADIAQYIARLDNAPELEKESADIIATAKFINDAANAPKSPSLAAKDVAAAKAELAKAEALAASAMSEAKAASSQKRKTSFRKR